MITWTRAAITVIAVAGWLWFDRFRALILLLCLTDLAVLGGRRLKIPPVIKSLPKSKVTRLLVMFFQLLLGMLSNDVSSLWRYAWVLHQIWPCGVWMLIHMLMLSYTTNVLIIYISNLWRRNIWSRWHTRGRHDVRDVHKRKPFLL